MSDDFNGNPRRWLYCCKIAYAWLNEAMKCVNERIDDISPIDDMEEMAYLRKARDGLQKGISAVSFLKSIDI